MAKLTFPIDTMEPGEIEAFRFIFDQYPNLEQKVSKMLRYVCYRFDPKCHKVRNAIGIDDRKAIAEELSGYTCPLADQSMVNEDGEFVPSEDWKMLSEVTAMFFMVLNKPRWEMICTFEIVIAEGFDMMRQPIVTTQEDLKLKNTELKAKLGDRNMKMLSDMEMAIERLSDEDPIARYGITEAVAERVRDGRTGKWIDRK